MRKFHALKVAEVRKIAPDAVSVHFEVPAEDRDIFRYREGQHITLRATVDGEELRRSYSIWPSVADNSLAVAVRRIEGGKFSRYANETLKEGDVLDVFPPAGSFHAPERGAEKGSKKGAGAARTFAAFAAGSGITPILSILKTTLEEEPGSHFILFYGNRTGESTLFREELAALKNHYMGRLSLFHFLSREKQELEFFNGRLDTAKTGEILKTVIAPERIGHAFLCGPSGMVEEVRRALLASGVDPGRLHIELFHSDPSSPDFSSPVLADAAAVRGKEGAVTLSIKLDGVERTVPHPGGDVTLLEAAEAAGLDVPFSCKSGMCCTCRAKLLDGEAEMKINYGLDEAEQKAGFILTCQAVPKTASVRIDYDA